MFTVKKVVPEVLKDLPENRLSYKAHSSAKWDGKHGVSGTPTDKFAQRQLMGSIESTIHAIGMLEGDGFVTVVIQKGWNIVHAELNMPTEKSRAVAQKAMKEIVSTAEVFAQVHPRAAFEMKWNVKSTFTDISLG